MSDLEYLSLNYQEHFEEMKQLIAACSDYFLVVEGYVPNDEDITALFADIPPNMPLDCLDLVGIFLNKQLVGAIWGAKGYPNAETVYIGLYIVNSAYRSQKIGEEGLRYFEEKMRNAGFNQLILAVVNENEKGMHFWKKHGFQFWRDCPARRVGQKTHDLTELYKILTV